MDSKESPEGLAAPDGRLPDWTRYTLVGVTTEQDTPNLVAAAHLGVKRYFALDSAAAVKAGWDKGLQGVVGAGARGGLCEGLETPAGDELKVTTVSAFARQVAEDGRLGPGPFVWCLDGESANFWTRMQSEVVPQAPRPLGRVL